MTAIGPLATSRGALIHVTSTSQHSGSDRLRLSTHGFALEVSPRHGYFPVLGIGNDRDRNSLHLFNRFSSATKS